MTTLIGPARYRVRFKDEDSARLASIETLGGTPPTVVDFLGESCLTFRAQRDGTVHVMDRRFVVDVVVEREDRYGDWHRVGTWEADDTEGVPDPTPLSKG